VRHPATLFRLYLIGFDQSSIFCFGGAPLLATCWISQYCKNGIFLIGVAMWTAEFLHDEVKALPYMLPLDIRASLERIAGLIRSHGLERNARTEGEAS